MVSLLPILSYSLRVNLSTEKTNKNLTKSDMMISEVAESKWH